MCGFLNEHGSCPVPDGTFADYSGWNLGEAGFYDEAFGPDEPFVHSADDVVQDISFDNEEDDDDLDYKEENVEEVPDHYDLLADKYGDDDYYATRYRVAYDDVEPKTPSYGGGHQHDLEDWGYGGRARQPYRKGPKSVPVWLRSRATIRNPNLLAEPAAMTVDQSWAA